MTTIALQFVLFFEFIGHQLLPLDRYRRQVEATRSEEQEDAQEVQMSPFLANTWYPVSRSKLAETTYREVCRCDAVHIASIGGSEK